MTTETRRKPSAAQLRALRSVSEYGQLSGNRRTLRALAAAGWATMEAQTTTRRVVGTGFNRTWVVPAVAYDFRITDAGRALLANAL